MNNVYVLKYKNWCDEEYEVVGVFTDKKLMNDAKIQYVKNSECDKDSHRWYYSVFILNKLDL